MFDHSSTIHYFGSPMIHLLQLCLFKLSHQFGLIPLTVPQLLLQALLLFPLQALLLFPLQVQFLVQHILSYLSV